MLLGKIYPTVGFQDIQSQPIRREKNVIKMQQLQYCDTSKIGEIPQFLDKVKASNYWCYKYKRKTNE